MSRWGSGPSPPCSHRSSPMSDRLPTSRTDGEYSAPARWSRGPRSQKLQHEAPLEWLLNCEDNQPRACIPKVSTRSAKSTLTRVQVHARTASQYAYSRVKARDVSV